MTTLLSTIDAKREGGKVDPPSKIFTKLVNKNNIKPQKCVPSPPKKKFPEPLHTLPPQNWLKPHGAGFSNSYLKHK